MGRTARAGQFGLVTSMYMESNRELVDAVRRAAELGLPVVNFKHKISIYVCLISAKRHMWKPPFKKNTVTF